MSNQTQIHVRATQNELARIKETAARLGMPVSRYMVAVALSSAGADTAVADIDARLRAIERRLDARLDEALAQQAGQLFDAKGEIVQAITGAVDEKVNATAQRIGNVVARSVTHANREGIVAMNDYLKNFGRWAQGRWSDAPKPPETGSSAEA